MKLKSLVLFLLVTMVSTLLAFGQEAPAPVWGDSHANAVLTRPIDEAVLVMLHGNTRPEANAANDRGRVPDSFLMPHMLLQLQRPAKQQQELDQFLQQIHDPNSPNFHRWLTAREFGERFGIAAEDIQTITNWLQSHGFKLDAVYANGTVISFSGTAGQVRRAFHTEIHRLEVNGEKHIANMSDPYIPAALSPAVAGVVSLNDFRPHPMNRPKTDFSVGGGLYLVVPADLATIYNLKPLFAAGYSGQGQTIVVVEDTDVYSTNDWTTFRQTLGLSSYSSGSFTQIHPSGSGSNSCSDPGVNSDDGEAILDAEWASATAPSAAIQLASCADTTVFGGHLALLNLLNASNPPAIVSISYGTSETALGAAYNNFVNQLHEQAVSEGVSVFVSSGDQAAAVSDRGAEVATHGINVNGFASTPYNVAVGGTDFGDTYENAASTYWSTTNGATYGSARSYIPEIPWNDSCASQLIAHYLTGSSVTYGSSGFCNSYDGSYLLNVMGGSGGPSGCATGSPASSGVVGGSCAGYAKPSWQSVLGNPHDGVRDLPDVSLFAANGFWMHYYVVCYSDTNNGGSSCAGTPDTWSGFGGTSISSPIMASMQALVNQATRGRWGNPNPLYYAIAAAEYGSTGSPACNSSLGNAVASGCVFYDVTAGDMDAPCIGSVNCYLPSGEVGVLSTSDSAYQPAFAATTGWDFATGIGTVNAYNLVATAVAIVSPPVVKLSAGSLVFGTQLFNTVSAKQSLTLSNTGKNPLVISSLKIAGGNASDFNLSQNCPSSLAAGAACTLSVTFKPTAAGTRNSSIAVTDNAQGSPQTVSLTGTGTVVVLSPTSLSFGTLPVGSLSKPQTVTLSNKGTTALSLSSLLIGGADAADFSKTTTCGSSLAAANSCTVTVTFKPRAKGARTATLQFTDNGGASPQSVALAGTGS